MLNDLFSFKKKINFLVILILTGTASIAQEEVTIVPQVTDTIPSKVTKTSMNKYDSATKAHSPKVAAMRSAIFLVLARSTIKNIGSFRLCTELWE